MNGITQVITCLMGEETDLNLLPHLSMSEIK